MEQNTKDRILSLLSNEEKARKLSTISSIEGVAEFFHVNGIELSKAVLAEIEQGAQTIVEKIDKGELTEDNLESIIGGSKDSKIDVKAVAALATLAIGGLSLAIAKAMPKVLDDVVTAGDQAKFTKTHPKTKIGMDAAVFASTIILAAGGGYMLYDSITNYKPYTPPTK